MHWKGRVVIQYLNQSADSIILQNACAYYQYLKTRRGNSNDKLPSFLTSYNLARIDTSHGSDNISREVRTTAPDNENHCGGSVQ